MFKHLLVLLGVVSLASNGAWASLIIDNADDVTASWTIGGNASSLTTIGGGVSGNARQLLANPSSAQSIFTTTSVAGDLSSYMDGSIEWDYKTLGIGATANGPFTPTFGYPRFLQVRISGGADPSTQWIEYNIRTWSDQGGLAWDVSSGWHTIKLALVNGLASLTGSEFDGIAATSATLPVAAKGAGMNTQAGVDDMWENVTSMYVGQTHYQGAGPFAAVAMDNLRIVPEPGTMSLLAIGSFVMTMRRRHRQV